MRDDVTKERKTPRDNISHVSKGQNLYFGTAIDKASDTIIISLTRKQGSKPCSHYHIKGKGKAVQATRDINARERVLTEEPLITFPIRTAGFRRPQSHARLKQDSNKEDRELYQYSRFASEGHASGSQGELQGAAWPTAERRQ